MSIISPTFTPTPYKSFTDAAVMGEMPAFADRYAAADRARWEINQKIGSIEAEIYAIQTGGYSSSFARSAALAKIPALQAQLPALRAQAAAIPPLSSITTEARVALQAKTAAASAAAPSGGTVANLQQFVNVIADTEGPAAAQQYIDRLKEGSNNFGIKIVEGAGVVIPAVVTIGLAKGAATLGAEVLADIKPPVSPETINKVIEAGKNVENQVDAALEKAKAAIPAVSLPSLALPPIPEVLVTNLFKPADNSVIPYKAGAAPALAPAAAGAPSAGPAREMDFLERVIKSIVDIFKGK